MRRLLLVLLLFASLSFAFERSNFKYVPEESFADFGFGCQVYTVDNSKSVTDFISNSPTASIVYKTGDTKNGKWEYLATVEKNHLVHDPDWHCMNYTAKNGTEAYNCTDQGTDRLEYYYVEEWKPMETSHIFEKSKITKIRYCAEYEMKLLPGEGYGARIDMVPTFAGNNYPEYAWFNSSWDKCMQINISSGFPANFSHLITLNTTNFNYSNAQADLGDLRALEGTCNNPSGSVLSMWNETINNSGESRIWIKTNTANISSIALYYNNSNANSVFDITETFLFGDDFDDGSLDSSKWHRMVSGGSYAESGGVFNVTGGSGAYEQWGSKTKIIPPAKYYMNVKFNVETQYHYIGARDDSDGNAQGNLDRIDAEHVVSSQAWGFINDGSSNSRIRGENLTTYSTMDIWVNISKTKIYLNGTSVLNETSYNPKTGDGMGVFITSRETTQTTSLNYTFIRKANADFSEPTYSFGDEEELNGSLSISVTLSDANETETKTMNINISGGGYDINQYNITVYYNNTLMLNDTVTGVSNTSVERDVSVVAPLVTSNDTNIPWNVSVSATINGTNFTTNESGNHSVDVWYHINNYTITKNANYTVEAANNFTVVAPSKPASSPESVTYSLNYTFPNCTWVYANGTETNTTCENTVTADLITAFRISPSHSSADGLIYSDIWINRTYTLSFDATSESTSSKTINETNYNASREYFVWIVESDNGSINGTSNISNIFNITFYDEADLTNTTADSVTSSYTVRFSDGTTKNYTISDSGTISEEIVRAYPDFYTATVSSTEVYSKSGYTTRSRFMTLASTDFSVQQNISIYFLNNSDATYAIINVIDNGDEVEGAVVSILKYYSNTSLYTQVDQVITNSEGKASSYLDVSGYYRFTVYDTDGSQAYVSTSPERFIYDGTQYSITINIGEDLDLDFITPYAVATCSGNASTNTISYTYSDYTGATETIRYLAWRSSNISSYDPVCNQSITGSSSSYACVLNGGENLSNYVYYCEVRITSSPERPVYGTIIDLITHAYITDWAIVSIMTVVGLGATGAVIHPIVGIVAMGVGFAALHVLEIAPINQTFIVYLLIAGGILIFLLGKGDER